MLRNISGPEAVLRARAACIGGIPVDLQDRPVRFLSCIRPISNVPVWPYEKRQLERCTFGWLKHAHYSCRMHSNASPLHRALPLSSIRIESRANRWKPSGHATTPSTCTAASLKQSVSPLWIYLWPSFVIRHTDWRRPLSQAPCIRIATLLNSVSLIVYCKCHEYSPHQRAEAPIGCRMSRCLLFMS